MTPESKTESLIDDDKKEKSAIQKIQVLKDLLGISTPMDEQASYGEYTKYIPVFTPEERQAIKDKIIYLIKSL
jgi:hypothetical protein